MQTKKCSKCKVEHSIDKFHKDKIQKSGYHPWCRSCRRKNRIKWSDNNRELHLKRLIDYSQTLKGRLVSIKTCAKRRGYEFHVTLEEYEKHIWNKPCNYCGGKTQNGIDRVDNSIGYKIENCVPCCKDCNKMKLTFSVDNFLLHIQKIIKHCSGVIPEPRKGNNK